MKTPINNLIILSILFYSSFVFAQDSLLNISNHEDCNSLMQIQLAKKVGPTNTPSGHGDILEFSKNSKESLHFIEQENHTVWYKFETKANGKLILEIEPLDSLNDYDFALYKYTDANFCDDVINKKLLPIRTNFSRNKPEKGSRTGLSVTATEDFVGAGINPAFSNTIEVKPKEEYVLLLNNVYDNGQGHILHFDYAVSLTLNGEVADLENKNSLDATVTLTNTKTGDIIASTTSDSVTGAYKLVFDLPKSQMNDPLHLEVSKDGYFFQDTILTAFKISKEIRDIKLQTKIRKIKQGERFIVQNILFHGNSAEPLATSLPTLKALYKTLLKNKTLKIRIEGHTNGCSNGVDFSNKLSVARAETVVNFLKDNQIDATRLSSIGFGCKKMLHSEHGPGSQLNRRVEIEVLEM